MIVIPAIDMQNGRCVRLVKGDFATSHEVAEDPLTVAMGFAEAGATWLHMVDLDGALSGRRENSDVFLNVAAESGLLVEVGGGIRDMETVAYYLDNGVQRVILGTAAIRQPALVAEAVARYGERIVVGVDARDGQVMVAGWSEEGRKDYLTVAKQMEGLGVSALIFTDISRDGTLSGPNLAPLKALQEQVSCRIIASGGIKGLEDIRALASLDLYAAICGKALYSGDLGLAEAIKLAGSR